MHHFLIFICIVIMNRFLTQFTAHYFLPPTAAANGVELLVIVLVTPGMALVADVVMVVVVVVLLVAVVFRASAAFCASRAARKLGLAPIITRNSW